MLDGLAEFCTKALAEHDCPSVSIAVAERGELVLQQAHSWADVAARRPATPQTAYRLASVAKTLTATGACLAADAGLLELDAPVPGRDPEPSPTIRQLLQHRGGFGAFYAFHYGAGESPIDPARYLTRLREPGSGFEYANLGYYLVGRALEAATGQSLGGYLRERLFEPLGMADSHLAAEYPGSAPVAQRYTADGRVYPVCSTPHPGASDAWATAGDLALFAQRYRSLLRPETVAAMHAGLPISEPLDYGLGWSVSRGAGPVVHSHGGGMGGVAAMLVAVPERELSVAVLCNSTNKTARDAILHHLLSELVPGCGPERYLVDTTQPARPMELPPGEWAGTIDTPEGEIPLRLRVLADRRIEAGLGGATATAAAAASPSWALRASLPLQLPTADARVAGPVLGLELRAEDGRLVGVARTYQDGEQGGWLGNFLTHRCELGPA
ncbi:serine hydrolase domain-containing protein [Kitasatospora azatica]|uniref:serine hydrolase domain-containing protein n=1 Tax=Kitasatospora azatica TaxID=58347 RepID=UPI000692465F|nr:serine hydrolase domain-containing protein [Kitasatospora azatica]